MIDAKSYVVRGRVPVGKEPAHVVLTPDGKSAYVTNEGSNSVTGINTATMKVIATIPVGNGPHGLRPVQTGKNCT